MGNILSNFEGLGPTEVAYGKSSYRGAYKLLGVKGGGGGGGGGANKAIYCIYMHI